MTCGDSTERAKKQPRRKVWAGAGVVAVRGPVIFSGSPSPLRPRSFSRNADVSWTAFRQVMAHICILEIKSLRARHARCAFRGHRSCGADQRMALISGPGIPCDQGRCRPRTAGTQRWPLATTAPAARTGTIWRTPPKTACSCCSASLNPAGSTFITITDADEALPVRLGHTARLRHFRGRTQRPPATVNTTSASSPGPATSPTASSSAQPPGITLAGPPEDQPLASENRP